MQPQFWHTRWAENQIGFHEPAVNPLLAAHFHALAVQEGARVFVPLCGKTLDIDWLLARGHRVAAVELSTTAVAQLFERLGVKPSITDGGALQRYSTDRLDVFAGNFFQLSAAMLGNVDAVYDRAALVALPSTMRTHYARHLLDLATGAPALLVTLEYDQQLVDGPPFAVPATEVSALHPGRVPRELSRQFQSTGLKGRFPVSEVAWHVPGRPRAA